MFHISKMTLFGIAVFLTRTIVLTRVERSQPAHELRYREVFGRDFLAALVFTLAIIPGADLSSTAGLRFAQLFPRH